MTPGKNILSELKSLSPYLAGLARQLPYAAPPGYFEQLPGTLLQKAKQPDDPKQELKELSVLLASLPKKSPFSIPDDYFNQVPEELTAGISAIEEAKEVLER